MKRFRSFLILPLLVACAHSTIALRITLTNNSEFADSDVYFWFTAESDYQLRLVGETENLALGTAYSLTELSGGLEMDRYVAGRIYISLGAPLPTVALNPNGRPERDPGVLPGDDGYLVRHDFMELTYTPNPADVADITSMDQFGIPIALQLRKEGIDLTGPNTFAGWKGHTDQQVIQYFQTQLPLDGENILTNGAGEFIRIKGATKFPTLYENDPNLSPPPERSMNAYLDKIHADQQVHGRKLIIKGQFSPTHDYEYEAVLDGQGNYILTKTGGHADNPDTITIPHSYKSDPGNPDSPMVTLAEDIYAANPHYSIDGGPVIPTQNTLEGAVARDLFAALNLGYVNSEHLITANDTVDPNLIGKFIHELTTDQMRSLTIAFSEVNNFYNLYANAIRILSDSYGYAYSDWNEHLTKVAILMNAEHNGQFADELNISFTGSVNAIPEPSTWALIAGGAALGLLLRHKKRTRQPNG